jgi:hypothetical protein
MKLNSSTISTKNMVISGKTTTVGVRVSTIARKYTSVVLTAAALLPIFTNMANASSIRASGLRYSGVLYSGQLLTYKNKVMIATLNKMVKPTDRVLALISRSHIIFNSIELDGNSGITSLSEASLVKIAESRACDINMYGFCLMNENKMTLPIGTLVNEAGITEVHVGKFDPKLSRVSVPKILQTKVKQRSMLVYLTNRLNLLTKKFGAKALIYSSAVSPLHVENDLMRAQRNAKVPAGELKPLEVVSVNERTITPVEITDTAEFVMVDPEVDAAQAAQAGQATNPVDQPTQAAQSTRPAQETPDNN